MCRESVALVVDYQAGRYASLTPFYAVRQALQTITGIETFGDLVREVGPIVGDRLWLAAIPLGMVDEALNASAKSGDADNQVFDPTIDSSGLASAAGVVWTEILRSIDKPIVCFVEDAYWLDTASSEFLEALLRSDSTLPIVFVVTRRPDGAGWRPAAPDIVLALGPLDDDSAAELVYRLTEHAPLSTAVQRDVIQRAQGNPLFLRELVLTADAGDELPPTIDVLLTDALAGLDPASRALVSVSAVLGVTSDIDVLAAVVDEPAERLTRRLESLARFIRLSGSTWRFTHALIREAAYNSLPYRRRQTAHRRAAEVYSSRSVPPIELVALHHSLSGDHTAAWESCRQAADHALSNGAPSEAMGFYERALSAGRAIRMDGVAVEQVREAFADAAFSTGATTKSLLAFRKARAALHGDVASENRLRLKEVRALRQLGRYPAALKLSRRALVAIERQPRLVRRLSAPLVQERGAIFYRQGDLQESLAACERAAWLAIDFGDDPILARAYMMLGTIREQLGLNEDAVYLDRALALFEKLGDLSSQATVLNNQASAAHARGDWATAARFWSESSARFRASGELGEAALPDLNTAELYSDQGRLTDAGPLLRRAAA